MYAPVDEDYSVTFDTSTTAKNFDCVFLALRWCGMVAFSQTVAKYRNAAIAFAYIRRQRYKLDNQANYPHHQASCYAFGESS